MKFLTISSIIALSIFCACNNSDEPIPYGSECKVTGAKVHVISDTINADAFKIYLKLESDNKYASEFGNYSYVTMPATDLRVTLNNYNDFQDLETPDVTKYFVVNDRSEELYETVESYLAKTKKKSLTPSLIFTNQSAINWKYETLITDTIKANLTVTITLQNGSKYIDDASVVLIPN